MKHFWNGLKNNGFTLIEVMIALAVFAVFATAFVTSQGYNILDSSTMREDLKLRELAQLKINEIIVDPPQFRESLTLSSDTKTFEEYPDYQYSIKYAKFEIPDFNKIIGGDDGSEEDSSFKAMQKKVGKIIKDNLEKILWQAELTITNKATKEKFTISTWLYNHEAEVKIEGI